MYERGSVITRWVGNRHETPEECARRTKVLLEEFARIDPKLACYQTTSRKRGKYVDTPLPSDEEGLTSLFAKGVIRNSDRVVVKNLGYSLHTTSPLKDACSLWINAGNTGNMNSCVLSLYFEGEDRERIVSVPGLTRILTAIVKAFQPDIGGAYFGDFAEAVCPEFEVRRKELHIGWLMYFSRSWGTVPPLPAPVRIDPMGDEGMLVILRPEPVSHTNPEDVELGRRVRTLLGKAGLLDHARLDL